MTEKIEFSHVNDPNSWDIQSPDFEGVVQIKVLCNWRLPPESTVEELNRTALRHELNVIARTFEAEIAKEIAAQCNHIADKS